MSILQNWMPSVLALVAFVWGYILPGWMSRDNENRIDDDGSNNSLNHKFHRQHATWRFAAIIAGALVGFVFPMGLIEKNWIDGIIRGFAYSLMCGGWFLRRFNLLLNRQRNPPKPDWYVSQSDNASYYDRALIAAAEVLYEPDTDADLAKFAERLQNKLTRTILVTCLIIGTLLFLWSMLS